MGGSAAVLGAIAAMFTVVAMALNLRFGCWVDKAGAHLFALALGASATMAGLIAAVFTVAFTAQM